jgi:hypothetical protein
MSPTALNKSASINLRYSLPSLPQREIQPMVGPNFEQLGKSLAGDGGARFCG